MASHISTPGSVGRPGKWPGKNHSSPVRCQLPTALDTGLEGDELIDEQKRWPVRQDIDRRRQRRHSASASNNFVGVSFGLILYQALRIEPSASIRNADRTIPMYVLP